MLLSLFYKGLHPEWFSDCHGLAGRSGAATRDCPTLWYSFGMAWVWDWCGLALLKCKVGVASMRLRHGFGVVLCGFGVFLVWVKL